MEDETRFDLNDLISDEDLANVDAAAEAFLKHQAEIEWHREHDPDFEAWYAEECRKTRAELDAITIHLTAEELYEKHRHYRGS